MAKENRLVYANDVLREILAVEPRLAYIVDRIKSVDAEVVTRCEDCEQYKPRNQSAHWNQTTRCCARSACLKFPPNGFCSYGERKKSK